MAQSATTGEQRRADTSHRITVHAQRLVDERGVDGFTMDDLAEVAGVSRRTLFNYFDSKVDAILGRKPDLPEDLLTRFRAGGPSGDLVTDMAALADVLISAQELTREEVELQRRVLRFDRLLLASHARLGEWAEEFVRLVAEREGEASDPRRARIAVNVFVGLLEISLDDFVTDPDARDFASTYAEVLATTRSVMAPVRDA